MLRRIPSHLLDNSPLVLRYSVDLEDLQRRAGEILYLAL
jgi:hypothetical protein